MFSQTDAMKRRDYRQEAHTDISLIRHYRRIRKLSQDELGEMVGTTGQNIQKMETGRSRLYLDWLEKIAVALDVGVADLIPNAYPPGKQVFVFECPENWSEELKEQTASLLEKLEASDPNSAQALTNAMEAIMKVSAPTPMNQSRRSA